MYILYLIWGFFLSEPVFQTKIAIIQQIRSHRHHDFQKEENQFKIESDRFELGTIYHLI